MIIGFKKQTSLLKTMLKYRYRFWHSRVLRLFL